MITLYAAMLVTLGFLVAALIMVVLLPAYRRRIERFTKETLKRTLPLTEDEIRADKDRLRADFAMETHRLQSKLEDATLMAARQRVEVNRRDAKIQELSEAIADQKMSVEEHENARRVLEQAILDRLPKVEQRLTETRKLLAMRDREIKSLAATGAKQAAALEEAAQLNKQREKEVAQLRTTLDTRAVRNRDPVKDANADANVALRVELEAVRAKAREQASVIERLQATAKAVSESEQNAEIKRLMLALAKAEGELNALKSSVGGEDAERMALEDRITDLQSASDTKSTEIAKLKALLQTYEEKDLRPPDFGEKADMASLQNEIDHQNRVIVELRAEIAAGQERLSRQALRFHEDMRRINPAIGDNASSEPPALPRPSLADRIAAPRARNSAANDTEGADHIDAGNSREQRPASRVRALNGAPANGSAEATSADESRPPPLPANEADSNGPVAGKSTAPRRPRLLERISGIDKG